MDELNLIGFFFTHSEETGRTVMVIKDASGEEHEVENGEQLWVAMVGIATNPSLPRCESSEVDESDGVMQAAGGDLYDFACEQAEGLVADVAGPAFGRMAAAVMRNNGKDALGFLRFISRKEPRR